MSQPNARGTNKSGRQAHKGPTVAAVESTPIPSALIAGGALGLLLALIGSGMLSYGHLANVYPPGCGEGSGCAEATRSAWGSIPGIGWPTSHIGLAYFLALAVAWFTIARRGISSGLLFVVRLGALASVLLSVVMFTNGYVCKYCLLAHGGNLLFWLCVEMAARASAGRSLMPAKAALGVFVFATVILIPIQVVAQNLADEVVEKNFDDDIKAIEETPDEQREVFTGRYLYGPERAAIRIVALTDYQCPDCGKFESELRSIMNSRDDISLSIKQFPMSDKCNDYMQQDMHANACMAARAAETAGIIGGPDAFWDMHFWLFDQGGEFTNATFRGDLEAMGYDYQEFTSIMLGDQPMELIKKDIEEGVDLGLFFTPMVFINGVELRSPHLAGNITRAIEQLTRDNPQPMTIAQAKDIPPTAREKFVNDWDTTPVRTMPEDTHDFPTGDDDPILDIVVWGDYSEFNTVMVDVEIRKRMAVQDGIRYRFRHFPMDQSCNNLASRTIHPKACLGAQAVEAAGMVGGNKAWWDMHSSIMLNYLTYDIRLIEDAAKQLGYDANQVLAYLNTEDTNERILEDAQAGKDMGLDRVPFIFINGKRLFRIMMKNKIALDYIFDAKLGALTEQQQRGLRGADLGGIGKQNVRYTDPNATKTPPANAPPTNLQGPAGPPGEN